MIGSLFGRSPRRGFTPPQPPSSLLNEMRAAAGFESPDHKPLSQSGGGRSLFGAFGRKNLPRTLGVLGAAMRQIDDEGPVLDQYLADEERRRTVEEAMAMTRGESARQKQQQQAVEALIARLPPDQQAVARANPEAYVESLLRGRQGPDWQYGQGYSHAFRVNPDGTVTRGDELPLRPRQGTNYGEDPTSDEWEPF